MPLGTAKSALDVLAGVTSEYLLNVGRTITFLSDKYANKMTPEVRVCLGATVRAFVHEHYRKSFFILCLRAEQLRYKT